MAGQLQSYTPEVCRYLADDFEEVIAKLESWNIRLIDVNRLRESLRVVRGVEAAGKFPEDTQALHRIANAFLDIHDFRYIARSLPTERMEPIARDLQRAVQGSLNRDGKTSQPFQFQSQFLIGTAVAFGGEQPIFPSTDIGRPVPEFFLSNGVSLYGIEVKRPSSPAALERVLRIAKRQIRDPRLHLAGIVLDLTDCLDRDLRGIIHRELVPDPFIDAKSRFAELALRAEDIVWDDSRRVHHAGFKNLGVLVSYVRCYAWFMKDLREPTLGHVFRFATLDPGGGKNLRWHRTEWLREILIRGLQGMGYVLQKTARL